jgi:DNA-binding CsgD family transcriptional regulator
VGASELKAALWTVYKNESSFVSPEFAARLFSAAQHNQSARIDIGLSHRETQILREVESGATNRMVAEKLRLNEKTVKHYISSIMQKYGVTNRVSAVMAYQRYARHRASTQFKPTLSRSSVGQVHEIEKGLAKSSPGAQKRTSWEIPYLVTAALDSGI